MAVGVSILVLGLSPRVRGSLCQLKYQFSVLRSIPACAGEPLATLIGAARVYSSVEYYQLYFTKYTPSASTMVLGASPKSRIRCSPTAVRSLHVMTIAPRPES